MIWSPARLDAPPELPPDPFWLFLTIGAVTGALLFLGLARPRLRGRTAAAAVAAAFWVFAGLAGAAMLTLWLLTEHHFAYRNENLFLLNPLALLLLPVAWRLLRGVPLSRTQSRLVLVVSAIAVAGFVVKGLPNLAQQNGHWIALFLPVHLGLAGAVLAQRNGDRMGATTSG